VKAYRRHFRWLGWRAPVSAWYFRISVSAPIGVPNGWGRCRSWRTACSKSLRTPNTALICTPSDAGRAFRPGDPAPHHAMKACPSTVCTVQSERALLPWFIAFSRSEPDSTSVGSGAQFGRWTRSGALSGFSGCKVSIMPVAATARFDGLLTCSISTTSHSISSLIRLPAARLYRDREGQAGE
jgi:hypothetical protein